MYVGMRPTFNTKSPNYGSGLSPTSGNKNEWRDWHKLTRLVDNYCYKVAKSEAVFATVVDPTGQTAANMAKSTCISQVQKLTWAKSTKTLTTVKVTAHGINLYQELKAEFFNSYQPYHYGGYNIVTPEDEGALMINFCLYPGTYQPSGHMNVSRAREFYFAYTSAFVGAADTNDPSSPTAAEAELMILAITINFLLISDGSAVLRYST